MYLSGEIKEVQEKQDGTLIVIKTEKPVGTWIREHAVRKLEVKLDDGRLISPEQRRKIYATIADIATWTGYLEEECKEWLKYYFIVSTGEDYISFSDCTVEQARKFITFLLDFAIRRGIWITGNIIDRSDDVEATLWSCIKYRKCCICGRKGELHHVDAIGMGFNRKVADDSQKRKMCLCRKHHTESHSIGQKDFCEKYKVFGVIYTGK